MRRPRPFPLSISRRQCSSRLATERRHCKANFGFARRIASRVCKSALPKYPESRQRADDAIKVAVRVRPMSGREMAAGLQVCVIPRAGEGVCVRVVAKLNLTRTQCNICEELRLLVVIKVASRGMQTFKHSPAEHISAASRLSVPLPCHILPDLAHWW